MAEDGFIVDLDGFFRSLDLKVKENRKAAERGMEKAIDDFADKSEARAPKQEGDLRGGMKKEVTVKEDRIIGQVTYSAKAEGGWFNYALKLHEMPEYDNPTTPNTEPKFLENPLKQNAERYKKIIADEIRKEL